MAWLKQLLTTLGVEEAQIEAIVGRIGKELPKHMVPKQRYNALSDARKRALESLGERDERLDKLQAELEALRLQIDKLKQERKRMKARYESEIRELRLLTALLIAIGGHAASAEAGQAADVTR